MKSPASHVFVVFGDQDEFTSISSHGWEAELNTHSGTTDRLKTVEVGNDWRGQAGGRLQHVLLEWSQ